MMIASDYVTNPLPSKTIFDLPNDILVIIFHKVIENLASIEQLKTISQLRLVCKKFWSITVDDYFLKTVIKKIFNRINFETTENFPPFRFQFDHIRVYFNQTFPLRNKLQEHWLKKSDDKQKDKPLTDVQRFLNFDKTENSSFAVTLGKKQDRNAPRVLLNNEKTQASHWNKTPNQVLGELNDPEKYKKHILKIPSDSPEKKTIAPSSLQNEGYE